VFPRGGQVGVDPGVLGERAVVHRFLHQHCPSSSARYTWSAARLVQADSDRTRLDAEEGGDLGGFIAVVAPGHDLPLPHGQPPQKAEDMLLFFPDNHGVARKAGELRRLADRGLLAGQRAAKVFARRDGPRPALRVFNRSPVLICPQHRFLRDAGGLIKVSTQRQNKC
jgi:hypothetical protein